MRSFEIYGKWSVQASKQTSKHTHARAQCSHASVGLAQARPNNHTQFQDFWGGKILAGGEIPGPPPLCMKPCTHTFLIVIGMYITV